VAIDSKATSHTRGNVSCQKKEISARKTKIQATGRQGAMSAARKSKKK
jgi:hypothetical protein